MSKPVEVGGGVLLLAQLFRYKTTKETKTNTNTKTKMGDPLPLLAYVVIGLFSQPAIFSLPEEDGTQLCRTCLGRKRHREIEESLSTLLTFIHLGLSIQKINILHNHHKRRQSGLIIIAGLIITGLVITRLLVFVITRIFKG